MSFDLEYLISKPVSITNIHKQKKEQKKKKWVLCLFEDSQLIHKAPNTQNKTNYKYHLIYVEVITTTDF